MDSKIYVFDLFAGKYRNINLHNYDDDRQVGVLYFDRAVLDELSRICTICGYVFFEEDGISYPIDIQPQKVVIFEGTFNCLSSKVKAIFTKHNICPSDDTKLSHFFYSWQLEGRFDCFDVHGEFIELCSMILERLEYSCLLPQHSIYTPANYCELCEMVKNIVFISRLDYSAKDYEIKYKYLIDSLINKYHIRISQDDINDLWEQICHIAKENLQGVAYD